MEKGRKGKETTENRRKKPKKIKTFLKKTRKGQKKTGTGSRDEERQRQIRKRRKWKGPS